ncbi:Argonaute complex, subunit Arb1 [Mariannaea sp. PMI_226]|nr:Argonaute complex, subunit Arb1 [Mariannaea sp. PMI_226]
MSQNDIQPEPSLHSDDEPSTLSSINGSSLQSMATGKKKRRKATTTSRGETALPKNRGNGFEEYFADPPMTPEEAREEKIAIYAPDLPFSERIQACIQRYRSRRRLQGERALMFNEYLFLGGVDTNPAAFGGFDPRELKDLTPAQRREATATDIIYGTTSAGDKFYNGDENAWTVDFAKVAAGFLSVTLVQITSFERKLMEQGIDLVGNFLRYVLHHDVSPEYTENINAALTICENAHREWPMLRNLNALWPGHFNLAAGELFRSDDTAESWSFQYSNSRKPQGFNAKSIFYAAIALLDEPELFSKICDNVPQVVKEFNCSLELVEISWPNQDITSRFKSLAIDGRNIELAPIGRANFKPVVIRDDWVDPVAQLPVTERITLFFEDKLLNNMPIGMKVRLTICETNIGLNFIKAVDILVPSFYTFLPQELMRHYKPPSETDRSAPSVYDPALEEK